VVFIRSFLFQIYLYVSVLVASILVVLAFPLPYSVKFSIARKWGASMLWVGEKVCSIKFVVEGQENIPLEPSVIMIKHSSVFEAYAQLVVFPEQTWVVKRELQWIPIFGWALSALNAISINRRSGRTAVTQVIEEGNKRLRDGIWITIFPEGTRMPPGETKKFGISGAALAKSANVKIVPVAHNAEDVWVSRQLEKKTRHGSILHWQANRNKWQRSQRN
jgi:1-acyl-sn-glycerol-3-phosphate acyltransferase